MTLIIHFGFRFYSSQWQRWPNIDPLGERGGFNLYAYGGNDPVNEMDPRGLDGINFSGPSIEELRIAIEEYGAKLNELPTGSPEWQSAYQARAALYKQLRNLLLKRAACRAAGRVGAIGAATGIGAFTGYYIRNEVNQGFQTVGAVLSDWWYGNPFGTSVPSEPESY